MAHSPPHRAGRLTSGKYGTLWLLGIAANLACTSGTVAPAHRGQEQSTGAPMQSPNTAGDGDSTGGAAPGASAPPSTPGAVPAPSAPQTIGPKETSSEGDGNHTIGPEYAQDANMGTIEGVAQGTWCTFVAPSGTSKFYTGLDANLKQPFNPIDRKVFVYLPAGFVPGEELPLMVANDGSQAKGYFSHVLDNLIAHKALPRLTAVCIDNGGGDSFGSERGWEYDVVSSTYGDFVNTEILPLATQNCQVAFSIDASARAAFGTSSGGAAAMSMGWFHPESYGRIITYSATLIPVWPTPQEPNGAGGYISHLFAESPKKNLRIYLNVGTKDLGAGKNDAWDWVLANTTAAAQLAAKEYHHQFYLSQGGNHVDQRVIDATLPRCQQL